MRVTAHIFTLEDAKGLLRAGIDAFAHGIRDQDVDDEVIALFKERPDVVLVPNLQVVVSRRISVGSEIQSHLVSLQNCKRDLLTGQRHRNRFRFRRET